MCDLPPLVDRRQRHLVGELDQHRNDRGPRLTACAGKSQALKCFEDLGFFCVDNLPIELVERFAELSTTAAHKRVALGMDIREGKALDRFPKLFKQISKQVPTRLVFLEADEASLIRRFSETRRPHPLGTGQSVAESIRSEKERLEPIRKLADPIIDTSRADIASPSPVPP